MFCLLFNVVCVYCWQLKWINEDFLSYSLEFNFMQTLLLDFLVVFVLVCVTYLSRSCGDPHFDHWFRMEA
ncbi:hypothetical protein L3X38_030972 [Prunus dulcis]|uniref:Uncharacterized protein n=1 Tax=Prunus dulcis TaxID=3755 RepID=A0AAD4VBC0_PRUDU|nr:hypothetical protein L3X38_030972 [Prunus dulcis]